MENFLVIICIGWKEYLVSIPENRMTQVLCDWTNTGKINKILSYSMNQIKEHVDMFTFLVNGAETISVEEMNRLLMIA